MNRKCWQKDCNKQLKMELIEIGICPEHGQVWRGIPEETITTFPYAGGTLTTGEVLIRDRQRKLDIAHIRAMAKNDNCFLPIVSHR